MPWCHWTPDAQDWSLLQYTVTALSMLLSAVLYWKIHAFAVAMRRGLAELQQTTSPALALTLNVSATPGLQHETELQQTTSPALALNVSATPGLQHETRTADLYSQVNVRFTTYLLAFYVSQLPSLVHRVVELASGDNEPSDFLTALQAVTQPLQGFLNALVYLQHAWPCREGARRQKLNADGLSAGEAGVNPELTSPPISSRID